MTIALLTLLSFIAAFVDGVSGGGGLIQIPGMLLLGIHPKIALGIDRFIGAFTSIPAIFNFNKEKKIKWSFVIKGIPFAIIGSYIGSNLALLFEEEILKRIIIYFLPFAFLTLFFIGKKEKHIDYKDFKNIIINIFIWFIVGLHAGFFGMGTGSTFILLVNLFLGLNLVVESANAKVFNIVANLISLYVFWGVGQIKYEYAIPMTISGIVGSYLGSKFVLKKGAKVVKIFLYFSFIGLFISLITQI